MQASDIDTSTCPPPFFSACADINPRTRYTAEQALSHAWVSGSTVKANNYLQSPKGIRDIMERSNSRGNLASAGSSGSLASAANGTTGSASGGGARGMPTAMPVPKYPGAVPVPSASTATTIRTTPQTQQSSSYQSSPQQHNHPHAGSYRAPQPIPGAHQAPIPPSHTTGIVQQQPPAQYGGYGAVDGIDPVGGLGRGLGMETAGLGVGGYSAPSTQRRTTIGAGNGVAQVSSRKYSR